MENFAILAFAITLVYSANSLSLPDYIKPCSRKDPDLGKCVLERAKATYPYLLKGDKKYKVTSLNPLHIPLIDVDAGPNLKLSFKNFVVSGLENVEIKSTSVDIDNKKMVMNLNTHILRFEGEYDVSGKILVLPITGNGDSNITFVGENYEFKFDWILNNKDGKEYMEIKNPHLDIKLKRAYFRFDNLFNGDKTLGDEMNKFLNENWEDVMTDIGAGISHTMETIVTDYFAKYMTTVPFDQVFVD